MPAALGNTIDLIDAALKAPIIVQEGESLNISGSLVDFDGDPILLAALLTFTLALYNDADNATILAPTSILNVGRGTVDASGNFLIRLDPADTPIIDATLAEKAVEIHLARLVWTWNDGASNRTGIQEIRHRVQKLDVLV